MIKKNIIFIILVISFCGLRENVFCSEFVIEKQVKKKNIKKRSKSKLQKEACQVFANQMSCGPQVHKNVADMQEILLEETIKYIESAKDGVLLKHKGDKINELVKVAKEFEEKMEQFCKDCEQYVTYLNAQKNTQK